MLKQWLALFSVTLGAFVLVTSEFLPAGILNEFVEHFNVSEGIAGLIISVTAISAAVAAPIITVLSGNLDKRWLLIASTFLLIISNIIIALTSSFTVTLLARLIIGFCLGTFWATAMSISFKLAPEGMSKAQSSSILMAGVTFASVIGVPLGTWLTGISSWQITFFVICALAGLVLFIQVASLPKLQEESAVTFADLPILLKNKYTLRGLLALLLLGLSHFAAYSYIAPFLAQSINHEKIVVLLFLFGIAGVAGNFFAGYLVGKSVSLAFYTISAVLFVLFILLPIMYQNVALLYVMIIVWGFAFAMFPVCANVWALGVAPEGKIPAAMSTIVTSFQLMILLGSLIGGVVVDTVGINYVFILSIIAIILAILLQKFSVPRKLAK